MKIRNRFTNRFFRTKQEQEENNEFVEDFTTDMFISKAFSNDEDDCLFI